MQSRNEPEQPSPRETVRQMVERYEALAGWPDPHRQYDADGETVIRRAVELVKMIEEKRQ